MNYNSIKRTSIAVTTLVLILLGSALGENPEIWILEQFSAPDINWGEHTQDPTASNKGGPAHITQNFTITKGSYRPKYKKGNPVPQKRDVSGSFSEGSPMSQRVSASGSTHANPNGKTQVEFTGTLTYTDPREDASPSVVSVKKSKSVPINFVGRGGGGGPGGGGYPPYYPPIVLPPTPPTDFPPIIIDPPADDLDEDGLDYNKEIQIGTNPNNPDTDGDGMPDGWEYRYALNPLSSLDASVDNDADGMVNLLEYQFDASPHQADSESASTNPNYPQGDGMSDIFEARFGTDPMRRDQAEPVATRWAMTKGQFLAASLDPNDSDEDGLSNIAEGILGTSPILASTDNDSNNLDPYSDYFEAIFGFDPTVAGDVLDDDKDGDLLSDRYEFINGTLPYIMDTDGDGVPDGWEFRYGLNVKSFQYGHLNDYWRMDNNSMQSTAGGFHDLVADPSRAWLTGDGSGIRFHEYEELKSQNGSYAIAPGATNVSFDGVNHSAIGFLIYPIDNVQRSSVICEKVESWKLGYDSQNKLWFEKFVSGVTYTRIATNIVLPANAWTRLFLVRSESPDGSKSIDLYLNGIKKYSIDLASELNVNAWPLIMGHPRSYPRYSPNCCLKDFRSYDAINSTTIISLTPGAVLPESDDLDGDGLGYAEEYLAGCDPEIPDTDGDELLDGDEVHPLAPALASLAYNTDSDFDGLDDLEERCRGTDPMSPDTDGDGVSDYIEIKVIGSNPKWTDTDEDQIPDGWEYQFGTNVIVNDASGDPDSDGISNLAEYNSIPKRNPSVNEAVVSLLDLDSDEDDLDDYSETRVYGTDPNNGHSLSPDVGDFEYVASGLKLPVGVGASASIDPNGDEDGDAVVNKEEILEANTNPRDAINFSAQIFAAVPLKKVADLKRPRTKNDTGYIASRTRSIRIQAADNGVYRLSRDKLGGELGFRGKVLLTGKSARKDTENIFELVDHHDGFKGSGDLTKRFLGMAFEKGYLLSEEVDISEFVNSLKRDADGYVTINCELQSPVKYGNDAASGGTGESSLIYPFGGSEGSGYGGVGGGGGYAGWSQFSPNDLNAYFKAVLNPTKPLGDPGVDLWGSTSIFLGGFGLDVDVMSATGEVYLDEDKEDSPGGVMGVLSMGTIGKSEKTSKVRVSAIGLLGAQRHLTFDDSLVAVYRDGVRISSSPVTYQESDGNIVLDVYAIQKSAGTLPLVDTQISVDVSASKSVPGDSVRIYTSNYKLEAEDEETVMPADMHVQLGMTDPFKTYFASVSTFTKGSNGIFEWNDAEDGSIVKFEAITAAGLRTATFTNSSKSTADGEVMASAKFHTQLNDKEDVYRIRIKLEKVKVGTSLLDLSDQSVGNGLLFESEKAIVMPGIADSIVLTRPDGTDMVIADGVTKVQVTAEAKDRYHNHVPDGAEINWSLNGPGTLGNKDEVFEEGLAYCTFIAPEKTDAGNLKVFTVSATTGQVFDSTAMGPKPTHVTVTADRTVVPLNDSTMKVNLKAIFDAGGAEVAEGTRVFWSTSNGTLRDVDTVIRKDLPFISGNPTARATLTIQGGRVGDVEIRVACADAVQTLHLTFTAGGSAQITLVQSNMGGKSHFIAGDANSQGTVNQYIGQNKVPVKYASILTFQVVATNNAYSRLKIGFADAGAPPDAGPDPKHAWIDDFEIMDVSKEDGENILVLDGNGRATFRVKSLGTKQLSATFVPGLLNASEGARIAASWIDVRDTSSGAKIIGDTIITASKNVLTGAVAAVSGAVLGANVYEPSTAELAGDIVAGVCIYGDIRDLAKEGWKGLVTGEEVSDLNIGLSIAGIFLTLQPEFDVCGEIFQTTLKAIPEGALVKLTKEVMLRGGDKLVTQGPKAAFKYMKSTAVVFGVLYCGEAGLPAMSGLVTSVAKYLHDEPEED